MSRGGFWSLFGGKPAGEGPASDPVEPPEVRAAHGRATTNDHAALAEKALAAGDLRHAAEHLSRAVADVPDRPDLLDLLKQLTQAAGEQPERLLPALDQPQFYGDAALRAWWLFRKGKVNDALSLIDQAAGANPNGEFLESWVLPWLEKPQALERAKPELVAAVLLRLSFRHPEYRQGTPASWAIMRRAAKIAESMRERHPNNQHLEVTYAALLRRAGRIDDAERILEGVHARDPGYATTIGLALITRLRGDVDDTIAAYKSALKQFPDDLALRLELGDALVDALRFDEAIPWYQDVLKRAPGHPWATASLIWCRGPLASNDRERSELQRRILELAGADPPNPRAAALVSVWIPYDGVPPTPRDATINGFRQYVENLRAEGKPFPKSEKLTLSALESPSCHTALRLEAARAGQPDFRLELKIEKVPQPDPRQPHGSPETVLWQYRGIYPAPAVDPPAERVAKAIGALAGTPYRLPAWWNQARPLARWLGTGSVPDLMAVMVHPPDLPADPELHGWDWVTRVQLAAALTIARMDSDWDDRSPRRQALTDLIHGPLDWTTEAAVIALAGVASETAAARKPIARLFRELFRRKPEGCHVDWLHALLWHWCRLPDLAEAERQHAAALLQEYEQAQ
jgi:tetratricopeptide (TPR) repeat protein